MRRVCFVQGGAERAGAERVLLTLLRHLDPQRVDPVVVFLAEGPFVDETERAGLQVVRAGRMSRLRHVGSLPTTVAALRAALARLQPDVVQATGEKMAVLAALASRGRWPVVAWLHDAPARHGAMAPALTQAALAIAPLASVVACSEWMARAFARRLRRDIVAIPNGIDVAVSADALAGRAVMAATGGWPADAVVVTHVARLERWKGTDVFVDAAALVASRCPQARFAVVGGALFGRDADWPDRLARRAEDRGLRGRLVFLGHRDDVANLMAGSDVVVHASRRADPFPTVVLEAMALGRPVVATRTRGPEEALGGDGLLVPPGQPAAMAAAVERLLTDPALRARLGRAGQARARERYRAERMARDFEEHWERLASHHRVDRGRAG